jgi:succinate dehydrogenase / fumarate reductase flavoprotein subunit
VQSEKGSAATTQERSYAVYETDVLIIGGGMCGLTAARRAISAGQNVIVVEKGRLGHSGASGMNWGQGIVTNEWAKDGGEASVQAMIMDYWGIADQDWCQAVMMGVREGRPAATAEQMGCVQQRTPGGDLIGGNNPELLLTLTYENRHRMWAQNALRSGMTIFENTMVIDILESSDGSAGGAVAINLTSGAASVFRSKTTIMATGQFAAVTGLTFHGPESTGDGHGILMKHGIPMAHMEYQSLDWLSWEPYGTKTNEEGLDLAGGIFLNADLWRRGYNKDMEAFAQEYFESDAYKLNPASGFPYFMVQGVKEIMQGRGTAEEGVYCYTGGLSEERDVCYGQFVAQIFDAYWGLGYEFPEYTEVVTYWANTCGMPSHLTPSMETDMPGMYMTCQGLSYYGSAMAFGQGWVAGNAAAEKAKILSLPEISWSRIDETLDSAYGLLEAEPDSPITATDIYEKIRTVFRLVLKPFHTEEDSQAAIDEFKRIETEDIPKMYVRSKSRILNREWRNAMEVGSMLLCAQASAHAQMIRKESRPYMFRKDYPKLDNSQYLKKIVISLNGGELSTSMEDINDSIIPVSELANILPDVDMTT